MSRLPLLRPQDLSAEQAQVAAAITRRRGATAISNADGSLRGPFNAFLHAPRLGRQLSELGEAVRFDTDFTPRQREIVTLAVAAWHRSEFEWYAHTALGRAAGLSEAEIESLERRSYDTFTDETERQMLGFVGESLRGELSEATYAATVQALGTERTVELTVLMGYYEMLARLLDVFRVTAPAE